MAFFDNAKAFIGKLDSSYDVDLSDRLKFVYTPWVLCGTALLVFASQYVGQPLQCWAPNQFAEGWESYAENYCFVENTYFVNMNASNLPSVADRENNEIRYYQWVPFILAIQALVFYLPRFTWKVLRKHSDLGLSNITISLRRNAKKIDNIKEVAELIPTKRRRGNWGNTLTLYLLFSKALSIFLLILQITVVVWFLGMGYLGGFNVVIDAISGRQWQESGNFPRVTFCDIEVREMGIVHRWTLQCVLMVNMFNEKIFVALWWWYNILLVISIFNLITWLKRLYMSNKISFICNILGICSVENPSISDIKEFCSKVLKNDGLTILHLIMENATIHEAGEFVFPLWHEYLNGSEAFNNSHLR